MPRKCVVTGKKTTTGNARSHAMNANKRSWGANLQKVRIWLTENLSVFGFRKSSTFWKS